MTLTTANVKRFQIIVISLLDYQSLCVSPKRNWSIATSLHRTLFDGPIIIMNQSITLRNHRKIRETWPGGLILTWMNPAQGRQPNSRQPFQTNSSVTAVHYYTHTHTHTNISLLNSLVQNKILQRASVSQSNDCLSVCLTFCVTPLKCPSVHKKNRNKYWIADAQKLKALAVSILRKLHFLLLLEIWLMAIRYICSYSFLD